MIDLILAGPNDPMWLENPVISKMLWPAVWQTIAMVACTTVATVILGTPLGLLLASSSPTGLRPRPALNRIVGVIVNVVRSFPFIVLLIALLPLTRFLVGTTLGWYAAVVPLTVGAVPFYARLVESNVSSVGSGKIEAAQMMGASNTRIEWGVQVKEALPQLVQSVTLLSVTLVGYSAMAGVLGAGGLGQLTYNYGYTGWQNDVMIVTVAVFLVIVQCMQMCGDMISRLVDHR